MAEIKNADAYWHTVIKNLDKNDYRANDNFYEHIDSVGDEYDIRRKTEKDRTSEIDNNYAESSLRESCIENWLLMMDNQSLHSAICSMKNQDIEFLFALSRCKFNCNEYAINNGLSKQGVAKRFRKTKDRIKFLMQKGCPK